MKTRAVPVREVPPPAQHALAQIAGPHMHPPLHRTRYRVHLEAGTLRTWSGARARSLAGTLRPTCARECKCLCTHEKVDACTCHSKHA